jgi:hypothetical protein
MIRTYGINDDDVDRAASVVAPFLSVAFEARESSFVGGGAYCLAEVPEGEIIVQQNCDDEGIVPLEIAWPLTHMLLVLDGIDHSSALKYIQRLKPLEEQGTLRFLSQRE